MLLESGASFARYTVEASLGDGGMGHVYRAFDTQLHRRVALKLLNAPRGDDRAHASPAAALLLREARAAAALNHGNAVTVFEVGEHDGVPFMAMELIEGRSLRHLIGHSEIGIVRHLRWLLGIASALAAAHAAGIVHLDVKPENVIIRDDDVAKVLDFGIARRRSFDPELAYPVRQDAERMHNLTGGGTIAGTPRYMAPEQIGRLDPDGRTDQFAWGVVAYEVLTGRSPWPGGDDLYSLFYSIVHQAPPAVSRLRSDVPDAVSAIVARAMAKIRDDRYPSMNEVTIALAAALDDLQASGRISFPGVVPSPRAPVSAAEAKTLQALLGADATLGDATLEVASTGPADARQSGDLSLPVLARSNGEPVSLPSAVSLPDAVSLPGASNRARQQADPSRARQQADPSRSRDQADSNIARDAADALAVQGSPFGSTMDDRGSTPAATSVSEAPATQRSGNVVLPSDAAAGKWRPLRVLAGAAALGLVALGTWFASSRTGPLAAPNGPACNEAAVRAYTSGSRALRSGDWEQARKSFTDATAADPECAAAHARLVVMGYWMAQPSKTRESMRRALELKSRLSDRDQSLLKCYEHVLWSTPPDDRSFATCLEQLSEKDPRDAELAYLASDFASSPSRQRDLAQRALDIDPEYSDAWQGLAVALERQDDEAGALEALDKCVAHVTTSIDCLGQRALVLRHMGRCADLEATGRQWIARTPDAAGAYYTLGSALAAEGRARAVVEEALAPRWARLKGTEGARNEPLERAALAALAGDFAAADQNARAIEALAKDGPDVEPRIDAALWLLDLGLETGTLDNTGAIASDLWSRKAAWDPGARRVGFDVKVLAFEPKLLRVLRVTKRMPEAEWNAARARWIDDARSSGGLDAEAIWVLGSALQCETASDAAEAMKTMPPAILTTLQWTTKLPGQLTFAYAGRALFLADRVDDALRLLRRATSSCSALEDPMLHTQAHVWLAEALEKKGDKAAACAALAVVARRWSAAASRTARLAAEKSKALGCAP